MYTWVERGTVQVKCLAQEHHTMSLARAQTGVERSNHDATTPPPKEIHMYLLTDTVIIFDTNLVIAWNTFF